MLKKESQLLFHNTIFKNFTGMDYNLKIRAKTTKLLEKIQGKPLWPWVK